MEFKIRNLKAPDLFKVTTIISKLGLREIKSCFNSDLKKAIEENKDNEQAIGIAVAFDIAGIILANLEKCEQELYELLASLSGLTEEEIKDLDGADFLDLIIQVITHKGNKGFFELASRYLGKK